MMNISRTLRVVISRTLLIVSLAFVPFSLFAATPLDINTATAAEFAAVMSGVGEKKAEAIVAFREANGNFESIEQLAQVKGIGDVLLTRNKPLLRVSVEEETSLN
ncbi:helix-hairpin-helix domain-containing protein [Marinomonas hwangdonensis]|uniref:Helix-hairpin-helix domain-containing protein n=1 Tax=Marinomonas hwangdonensis TaxID=1053647 RepID=A0A3M8Q7R0_9GAMM|nr:ComEA family DNA-binding protein [Marinomonas hwangdonensis]MDP5057565.1 helix-hairpin-helix domain-containing protein [Marinomonas hwangdonensis]RNF52109.1 helix-hairpin-helix domain-containing protein [Marinomonas hwangdonensis]